MNSVMAAVLAAIAAVFATVGFILFGKPKGSEGGSSSRIEQVQPTVKPEVAVNREETPVPSSVEISETLPPPSDSTIDPWNEEQIAPTPVSAEGSSDALTLETVEQPDVAIEDSDEEPVELNLDDATQVAEPVATQSLRATATTRYTTSNPAPSATIQQAPFAVIQDPQRPASPELQELSQKILAWGESGTAENLKTVVSYAQHPDAMIRRYVAVAIGKVAAQGTIGGDDLRSAIPTLETLTKDTDPKVQKMAIKSLASVKG